MDGNEFEKSMLSFKPRDLREEFLDTDRTEGEKRGNPEIVVVVMTAIPRILRETEDAEVAVVVVSVDTADADDINNRVKYAVRRSSKQYIYILFNHPSFILRYRNAQTLFVNSSDFVRTVNVTPLSTTIRV